MNKVAIVGVQQSGKTALMVSWGWHYLSQDRNGYYLLSDPFGGGVTRDFICDEMNRMKHGKWPDATSPDSVKRLNWILGRKGKTIGSMMFMDYGGEIYRKAFKDGPYATMSLKRSDVVAAARKTLPDEKDAIALLRWHVKTCTALVILVDLGYIINNPPLSDKNAREMISTIQCMMQIMRWRGKPKCVAIAFSQCDMYESTLKKLGGVQNAFRQYLPEIAAHYPHTKLLAVSAVNKTVPGFQGMPVPAPDFKADGLEALTKWVAAQMLRTRRMIIRNTILVILAFLFLCILCSN